MVVVRNPRSKWLRNSLISAGVLLVLMIGGGVAYTYFYGPDGSDAAIPKPTTDTAEPNTPFTPRKPAANAVESASVQTLTTPIPPGANASISVKTNPTSTCKISVVYNGAASTDSGLAPKVADDYGTVTWTWTVADTVPLGTYPVNVTCEYNTRSAVTRGELVVAKEAAAQ
jgi:hypothetical protein